MNDAGYLSYRMAQIVSKMLPRRFAYWLGLRIADYFYASDRAGRLVVMSNLARILNSQDIRPSDETLRQMARKNFQLFGKYLVDFFKFSDFSRDTIKRLVSLEHFEHLEKAESLGKGVLMITAHLGNWELGGAVVSSLGRRLSVVVQPLRGNRVNELFRKHRNERGMHVIPLGRAARGVLLALRQKEHVAMLADRDFTMHNELMPFFGKPARLPSGPARIAIKTGAPLVPGFLLRQPDETFLFRLHPPILPADAGCVDDLRRGICSVMEKEIAKNPLQWFMFDDFWHPARQP